MCVCICVRVCTSLEFLLHNCLCGVSDVEGGVLLWVGWSNDGHQVVAISSIDL